MARLPPFQANGLLPPGDYVLTLGELRSSALVLGPGDPKDYPTWDATWREKLVLNLGTLVRQLWQVAIHEIFVDGSFVEDKDHPNDIDGYFVCDLQFLATGELQRQLNLLDPYKIWTWDPASRRAFVDTPRDNFPCSTNIVSSFIRMSVRPVACGTSTGMNWNFLLPSADRGATESRRGSSESETSHDSQ